jgi:UDP:flavonoid glycosyltransferase YjiC (YdhE family)
VAIVTSSGQEDKPEVAGRISWSGVGRRLNSETPSPAAVGSAVRAVLQDASYRASAQRIATSMVHTRGTTHLAELVDQVAATPHPLPTDHG